MTSASRQIDAIPAWKRWVKRATEASELCDDIPEAGEDFAVSVQEKLDKIAETIERTEYVTPDQQRAIENMEHGIDRWLNH